jgi:hypothetical protein
LGPKAASAMWRSSCTVVGRPSAGQGSEVRRRPQCEQSRPGVTNRLRWRAFGSRAGLGRVQRACRFLARHWASSCCPWFLSCSWRGVLGTTPLLRRTRRRCFRGRFPCGDSVRVRMRSPSCAGRPRLRRHLRCGQRRPGQAASGVPGLVFINPYEAGSRSTVTGTPSYSATLDEK